MRFLYGGITLHWLISLLEKYRRRSSDLIKMVIPYLYSLPRGESIEAMHHEDLMPMMFIMGGLLSSVYNKGGGHSNR
jgi:hypothetical protein